MPHYLFVTGRLAEQPLRRVLASLASEVGFEFSVAVMPITIAALITPRWLARHLEVPEGTTAVIVPGHCGGDLSMVEEVAKVPVQRGPRDLRELPEFYGRKNESSEYGDWDIEIIARISSADDLPVDETLDRAASLAGDGADVVLLAGSGRRWPGLAMVVEELCEEDRRVAVADVAPLDLLGVVPRGVELVFPANLEQQEVAAGLGCEIVLQASAMSGDELERMVDKASRQGVRLRIDPGLQPIGLGLTGSLNRYLETRRQLPQLPLVMCLDPVTETTAVDTGALHVLFVGLCQELLVGSVVVSQGSNRTRTAVRECHLARQMSHYVARCKSPARDVEPGLLMLRDAAALEFGREELDHLAEVLKDPSPRLYAEGGRLHAVSEGKHLESDDPYDLFDQIQSNTDRTFDAGRAFYLGYEMAKAVTALTLGKTYRQDEALHWGMLTRRELTRLERRAMRLARLRDGECEETRRYYEKDEADDAFGES
jgi:hypothetical protein